LHGVVKADRKLIMSYLVAPERFSMSKGSDLFVAALENEGSSKFSALREKETWTSDVRGGAVRSSVAPMAASGNVISYIKFVSLSILLHRTMHYGADGFPKVQWEDH
jgi:hypothetical protein